MKLKMKKIVATVTALALSLTGAITLGITSNAQTYTNDNTGQTLTVEDSVNFDIPEASLYAGTDFKELNKADLSSQYCNTTFWIYNTLEEAREDNINKAIKSYSNVAVEEGRDYYLNVRVGAGERTNEAFVLGGYYFGTNTTSFTCTNGEVVEVSLNSPYTQTGYTGLTDTISGSGHVIVKVTGKANPNAVAPAQETQETPVVDTPAVEAAPVEAVAEPTPVATETPAPAQTVKAENTAPKTGDTLPIVPFVLMGVGVVAGSVVVLQKRYF